MIAWILLGLAFALWWGGLAIALIVEADDPPDWCPYLLGSTLTALFMLAVLQIVMMR